MTLTKADLVEEILSKVKPISKKDCKLLTDLFFDVISQGLLEEGEVKIHRFGNFFCRQKAERMGRNPQSGEAKIITKRKVASFHASVHLKVTDSSIDNDAIHGTTQLSEEVGA